MARSPVPLQASAARTLIKKARVALGMTQSELAKHLSVSKRTIIRWENAGAVASFLDVMRASHLLDKKAPALAAEMREHAWAMADTVGYPAAELEKVEPPPRTPAGRAADRVVEMTARAFGREAAVVKKVLRAALAHAVKAGIPLGELWNELEG